MSTIYEIPLSAKPQTFSIVLADVTYQLTLQYVSATNGGWILSIADSDGTDIVCGIPLVTGTDLLGQYAYLGIGGTLTVATDGDADAVPTYGNLGTNSHLYFTVN